MIKYIIFDFDGTLADSREVFISVFNQIAEKHNYRKMEAENLHHLRTLTITERCRYLKVPLYRIPFLATEFLSLYKKALQNVLLFDGIKELLEALNSLGYEMAIISSNAESNISDFLKSNGIGSISKIYCSTSLFGKDKLIKGFLKKYGLSNDQVLYVGDELRDIVACKKAGIKIAWADWGYELEQMVMDAGPDYKLSQPADLLTILKT